MTPIIIHPVHQFTWNEDAAHVAADRVGVQITLTHLHDRVLVWGAGAEWMDEYCEIMEQIIKGEGPEVHDESYSH
jgi:hypothetical protein